jgi:hypothetical protein
LVIVVLFPVFVWIADSLRPRLSPELPDAERATVADFIVRNSEVLAGTDYSIRTVNVYGVFSRFESTVNE